MPKRMDRDAGLDRSSDLVAGLAAAETMRSAAESAHFKGEIAKKEDEKVSVFWRVFGGTILSIVALGGVTLYNGLSTSISELRSELNKERECRAELVKKDEYNARSTSLYERIRAAEGMQNALAALKTEHDGLKERLTANAAAVDACKKDAVALDTLRERVIALEAVKKDLAGLDLLKERVAGLAADLKAARDESLKAAQDLAQTRAADAERRNSHDGQIKQVEEMVKDLSKGVNECRERLARLEGQQPTGPAGPMSVKPVRYEPPAKDAAP